MARQMEHTHCTPSMDIFNRQFGLIIAYLLPGFVALASAAPLVPAVAGWMRADQTAGFGAPLYALLAATAAGMVVSCFRWLVIDQIHALTRIASPSFSARALGTQPNAFNYLVESHYRYYQFYSNMLVAVIWTYSVHRWLTRSPLLNLTTDFGIAVLCGVLFAGSRDALSKYRSRTRQLASEVALNIWERNAMTNGIDHNQGNGCNTEKSPSASKSIVRPKPTKPQQAQNNPKRSKP